MTSSRRTDALIRWRGSWTWSARSCCRNRGGIGGRRGRGRRGGSPAVGGGRPPHPLAHGRHGLRRGGELGGGCRGHLGPGNGPDARPVGADPRRRAFQPARAALVVHGGARARSGDTAAARRDRRHGRSRGRHSAGSASRGCHGPGDRERTARRAAARAAGSSPETLGSVAGAAAHPRPRPRPAGGGRVDARAQRAPRRDPAAARGAPRGDVGRGVERGGVRSPGRRDAAA